MSFSYSALCATCKHNPSTTSCQGCRGKYCSTCIYEHRADLSRELDGLFNIRNEFVENISNPSTKIHPDFDEIDRWEKEMHGHIDCIASTARDQVRQFQSESSKNVRIELDEISKELQERQKTGGYIEDDLNRIKQQLKNLGSIIQQSNEQIRIDTSVSNNIDWNSLIRVMPIHGSRTNSISNNFQANQAPNYSQKHPVPNYFQTNPNFYNPSDSLSNSKKSMPYQQVYSRESTSYMPCRTGMPLNSTRGASMGMGNPISHFTCIGCKTVNDYYENGRNICSACKCPAPL
ncbi:unnamed protein product [Rotaria magnacalcarata]|uniref:Uncharacterized protein n=1 Tax=Rotaria magnacalcarata TaxID=392030 RepID=A0A816RT11_9BILA|nr:unnamed protein product [Rotaria magnacalcarata]CAF3864156.1 unnamed protein product [Rotaria magnacalcarata]